MPYPNDDQYNPYPGTEAMNEPDPSMTTLEVICGYPDEPGTFASPPFYLKEAGPFQIYVHDMTKLQDFHVDLGTITIKRDGIWVTEDHIMSFLVGCLPSEATDDPDWYFPPSCPRQTVDESESAPLDTANWNALVGWNTSAADVNGVIVTLRDLDGNYWPQPQNFRNMVSMGNLTYVAGTCDDWAWTNPRDASKIMTIKTPQVSGNHPLSHCQQYRYNFYGAQYVASGRHISLLMPSITLLIGGLLISTCSAAYTPRKRQ
jgi:hypothetical protein